MLREPPAAIRCRRSQPSTSRPRNSGAAADPLHSALRVSTNFFEAPGLLATVGPSSTLAKATAIALKRGTLFSLGQLVKLSLNSNLNLTDLNRLIRGATRARCIARRE